MNAKIVNASATLVVGSDSRIAIAIARCLSRHGVPVDIAVPRGVYCRSIHIRKRHWLSSLEDAPTVATDLMRLVGEVGYDAVFPTNDLALAAISQHHPLLSSVAHIGCPPADTVISVLSKEKTLAAAQALGIDVPNTQMGAELQKPEDLRLEYPVIAKPVSKALRSSVKVLHIRDEGELAGFLSDWRGALHHFLFQQYIPGVGMGVELLIHEDRALAVFQHQREEELPATGGVSVLARAVSPDTRLVRNSKQLLNLLGWEGVAMVEYRYDQETQKATLMEVNGRYWGSLALSDAAGLEFPWYQWQLMHGVDPQIPSTFRIGTRVAWTAGRVDRLLGYLVQRPPRWLYASSPGRELVSFIKRVPPFTTDAVWRLRDPLAAVSEFEQVVGKLAKCAPPGLTKFKKLSGKAKLNYLKLRLGLGSSIIHAPGDVRSILIVCQGNIIRSAFAEALMRRDLSPLGVEVVSCGTRASEPMADATAIECAPLFGTDLSEHRPQKLTKQLLDRADLVLAMDLFNLAQVRSEYPASNPAKAMLFSAFSDGNSARPKPIRDPYGSDWKTLRQCFQTIAEQVEAIRKRMVDRFKNDDKENDQDGIDAAS